MDLHTNYPYSLIRHGIINTYPSLKKNIKTEVAVLGSGITGALVAWHLNKKGISCVVADKRHTGMGSTAASTSLIQYEIDTPLHQLVKKVGYKNAVKSYKISLQAVHDLQKICKQLHPNIFVNKCSLQYASFKKDVTDLEKEFKIRKENGFQLELLTADVIKNKFGLNAPAALLTNDAARLDAYVLTHEILNKIRGNHCQIFDNTNVVSIEHQKNRVVLTTEANNTITARKLVIACGYESQKYLTKKVEEKKCTYAIISEVMENQIFWYENCLIWETAIPYLYIRTTSDNRIIVGGKDTAYLPAEGQRKLLQTKAKELQTSFKRLFPHIPFKTDFRWSGAFGNSKDGLPYIGSIPERPHTLFALGYGGNGITFSVVAAQMIAEIINGEKPANLSLFSFNR